MSLLLVLFKPSSCIHLFHWRNSSIIHPADSLLLRLLCKQQKKKEEKVRLIFRLLKTSAHLQPVLPPPVSTVLHYLGLGLGQFQVQVDLKEFFRQRSFSSQTVWWKWNDLCWPLQTQIWTQNRPSGLLQSQNPSDRTHRDPARLMWWVLMVQSTGTGASEVQEGQEGLSRTCRTSCLASSQICVSYMIPFNCFLFSHVFMCFLMYFCFM